LTVATALTVLPAAVRVAGAAVVGVVRGFAIVLATALAIAGLAAASPAGVLQHEALAGYFAGGVLQQDYVAYSAAAYVMREGYLTGAAAADVLQQGSLAHSVDGGFAFVQRAVCVGVGVVRAVCVAPSVVSVAAFGEDVLESQLIQVGVVFDSEADVYIVELLGAGWMQQLYSHPS
jgi:hypothetical protein